MRNWLPCIWALQWRAAGYLRRCAPGPGRRPGRRGRAPGWCGGALGRRCACRTCPARSPGMWQSARGRREWGIQSSWKTNKVHISFRIAVLIYRLTGQKNNKFLPQPWECLSALYLKLKVISNCWRLNLLINLTPFKRSLLIASALQLQYTPLSRITSHDSTISMMIIFLPTEYSYCLVWQS